MGTLTNFLNLLKPNENDYYDVLTEQSENWQKIDEWAKEIDDSNIKKQNKNDYSLETVSKNIVEAINEVNTEAKREKGDKLPIGTILTYVSDNIPLEYLLCDGREITRDKYQELYDTLKPTSIKESDLRLMADHMIPQLNSNNQNGYVVSVSSMYSSEHDGYKVLDNSDSTAWVTQNGQKNGWIKIKYPKNQIIDSFRIKPYSQSKKIRKVTLFGISNNIEEQLFTEDILIDLTNNEYKMFKVPFKAKEYQEFKIEISNDATDPYCGISELKIYTAAIDSLVPLDDKGQPQIVGKKYLPLGKFGDGLVKSGENENGKYRIYASGYIEQWGKGYASGGVATVTLPIPMNNNIYNISANAESNGWPGGCDIHTLTKTNFKMFLKNYENSHDWYYTGSFFWKMNGYLNSISNTNNLIIKAKNAPLADNNQRADGNAYMLDGKTRREFEKEININKTNILNLAKKMPKKYKEIRGVKGYGYTTSTFSGWKSKYISIGTHKIYGVRFKIKARENPITQIKTEISINGNIISSEIQNTRIKANQEEYIDITLLDNIIINPNDTIEISYKCNQLCDLYKTMAETSFGNSYELYYVTRGEMNSEWTKTIGGDTKTAINFISFIEYFDTIDLDKRTSEIGSVANNNNENIKRLNTLPIETTDTNKFSLCETSKPEKTNMFGDVFIGYGTYAKKSDLLKNGDILGIKLNGFNIKGNNQKVNVNISFFNPEVDKKTITFIQPIVKLSSEIVANGIDDYLLKTYITEEMIKAVPEEFVLGFDCELPLSSSSDKTCIYKEKNAIEISFKDIPFFKYCWYKTKNSWDFVAKSSELSADAWGTPNIDFLYTLDIANDYLNKLKTIPLTVIDTNKFSLCENNISKADSITPAIIGYSTYMKKSDILKNGDIYGIRLNGFNIDGNNEEFEMNIECLDPNTKDVLKRFKTKFKANGIDNYILQLDITKQDLKDIPEEFVLGFWSNQPMKPGSNNTCIYSEKNEILTEDGQDLKYCWYRTKFSWANVVSSGALYWGNPNIDFLYSVTIKGITDNNNQKSLLELPNKIDMIVDDTIELFYKGMINATNTNIYSIGFDCDTNIGQAYSRKYVYTPTQNDVGEKKVEVKLIDNTGDIIDKKKVIFKIHNKPTNPSQKKIVLCIGDSLTTSGVWCNEFRKRLIGTSDYPQKYNITNIDFIGTKETYGTKYEGYGGWTFNSYLTANKTSEFMYICGSFDKTSTDQHSVYKDSNNIEWKLETISSTKIKIIRLNYTTKPLPASGTLVWVRGGENHSNTVYNSSEMAEGNPFWNSSVGKVDFRNYIKQFNVSQIDYAYILLGWNNTGNTIEEYKSKCEEFLDILLRDFPNCKIGLIGLQVPSQNGFGENYGISWKYYEKLQWIWKLQNLYQEISDSIKYKGKVDYINLSTQFDSEYNFPSAKRNVNLRNNYFQENIQTNGVHPDTTGYLQIADTVLRNFIGKINK